MSASQEDLRNLQLLEDLVVITVFYTPAKVADWLGISLAGGLGHVHVLYELSDRQPLLNTSVLAVHSDGVCLAYHSEALGRLPLVSAMGRKRM